MFINQEFTYEFAYRQTTTFLACFAYSSVYAELKSVNVAFNWFICLVFVLYTTFSIFIQTDVYKCLPTNSMMRCCSAEHTSRG